MEFLAHVREDGQFALFYQIFSGAGQGWYIDKLSTANDFSLVNTDDYKASNLNAYIVVRGLQDLKIGLNRGTGANSCVSGPDNLKSTL